MKAKKDIRITAGTLKGRRLLSLRGDRVRPTGARVKEALFSIIGDSIYGARFLDLFSGSGNIGIEALSRGASLCTFIEKDKDVIDILKKNLNNLGLKERTRLIPGDTKRGVRLLGRDGERFDIVFLDPPYRYFNRAKEVIHLALKNDIVKERGILIWEHDITRTPDPLIETLIKNKTKRYGDTGITFYLKR